ncbi:5-bromo-4-chloroindolyl phosphate hydrolysis family protein [Solibacillus sp. CAU 1738]|uniref:5-bromo-4-chloroindolyl phosphate hydrolysis family protein n=1 Tax=Solibacillus sp. CAU 1738 TaxID=3140363 RepID=UPI003261B212
MLGTINFISRHAFNFAISFAVLVITVINFDLGIVFVPLLAIGSYYISNKGILMFQRIKKSKELGFTRSEYKHIERQLKMAKDNMNQLTQQYVRVRSIRSFKLLNEISKISRRIINLVQANPRKFYAVEDFFYAHLPSAVQLTDKYTLLTKEQVKGTEIHLALEETRKTLKDLYGTMEDDLKLALASDIENLKIELDFAKLENDKMKERIVGGDK